MTQQEGAPPYPVPAEAEALGGTVQTLAQRVDPDAEIVTETDALRATNVLAQIAEARRSSERARTALVKPLNDHVAFINRTFKERLAPLLDLEKRLKAKLTARQRKLDAEAAEERRRAEEAARAEQARHDTLAALAGDEQPPPVTDVEVLPAPPPPPRRTLATAVGQSMFKKRWTHEVTDIAALARERPDLVVPNDKAIRDLYRSKEARETCPPERLAIPGVRVYQEDDVAVRT